MYVNCECMLLCVFEMGKKHNNCTIHFSGRDENTKKNINKIKEMHLNTNKFAKEMVEDIIFLFLCCDSHMYREQ